jgi:hypothetical protein
VHGTELPKYLKKKKKKKKKKKPTTTTTTKKKLTLVRNSYKEPATNS